MFLTFFKDQEVKNMLMDVVFCVSLCSHIPGGYNVKSLGWASLNSTFLAQNLEWKWSLSIEACN